MTKERAETVRLLNEHYDILKAIVDAPDSVLTRDERRDLNEKIERLGESIRKIT
jgi:hypothetical protein